MLSIKKTTEFSDWFAKLHLGYQRQIDARLLRIADYAHFGDAKYIGDGVAELRWKNGLRIYFCKQDQQTVILLLGGLKNGQVKDIKKAKILIRGYASDRAC